MTSGRGPKTPEAGVAHRVAGSTCQYAGEFKSARDHLERALACLEPGRDEDLAFRFGQDAIMAVNIYFAHVLWPAGEVESALVFADAADRRLLPITHVGTLAYSRCHLSFFALMIGDFARARSNAAEGSRLAREYDLTLWRAYAAHMEALANALLDGEAGSDFAEIRRTAELIRAQQGAPYDGLFKSVYARALVM